MRLLAATFCAVALTGCASNLPYSIAIGHPNPNTPLPGKEQCVLRLDDLVEEMAEKYKNNTPALTIRSLQVEFETALYNRTGGETRDTWERFWDWLPPSRRLEPPKDVLANCTDNNGHPVQQEDYPALEKISKKWLTTYALDATNPDQELDHFHEYVRSAQLVQHLANQRIWQLTPDEDPLNTYDLVEQTSMRQSQWCGALPPETEKESPCLKGQSLYHVTTTPTDLYEQLLSDIAQVETTGTQRDQRYFALSYEIPWDGDRTLVRYGVTFYFKQATQNKSVQLLGYDLVYANEATPQPLEEKTAGVTPQRSEQNTSSWAAEAWHSTGYPFSLVIGLKNAAFEVTKIPFSFIAGRAFGRDAWNYPLTNLLTARDALLVETTTKPRGGLEWGIYRLFTEIPLVGQIFQYNFSFDRSEQDKPSPDARRKLFLSRGIYGGHKWGQDTGLWALFAKQSYPDYDIYSPPYRHGTVIDVVWSMFNLSHGPAYSEARYIINHATREDRLYLAGHSGGVQRSAAASRILSLHDYRVIKAVGIAGPSIGQAFVDPRYPEAFKIYLNTKSGANEDVVSKIGVVAGAFSTLLDYTTLVPLKYIVGNLAFLKRDELYQTFDRIGFTNATIVEVARKPSSRHQTPLRLSFTDRLVFDAYVRNEFATAFREDLERPDSPHETDRPNAFPWSR
ncbi:MAG: hypothetical protein OEV77_11445 [Nitrospira sp.]|nr:hypothetical protein [Nitrospira sp.]